MQSTRQGDRARRGDRLVCWDPKSQTTETRGGTEKGANREDGRGRYDGTHVDEVVIYEGSLGQYMQLNPIRNALEGCSQRRRGYRFAHDKSSSISRNPPSNPRTLQHS